MARRARRAVAGERGVSNCGKGASHLSAGACSATWQARQDVVYCQ